MRKEAANGDASMPPWWHAWGMAMAAACGLIFYAVVVSFERPTPAYHAAISYEIIYWVSMLAAFLVLGPWRPGLPRVGRVWPWLLCAAVLLLATAAADSQFQAWARFRLYYAILLLGFVLWMCFRIGGRNLTQLVLTAIGIVHAAVLVLVLMASATANPADPFNQSWVPYHAHVRHVSYHGMIAACAGLSVAFIGGKLRSLGYVTAVTALFGIVYFGARGALVGWLAFALVACALLPRRLATIASCVAVLLLAVVAAKLVGDSWHQAPFTGNLIQRADSVDSVVHSTGRTTIWTDAFAAIKVKPVLGHGPEGYLTSRCCRPGTVQPHNTPVQILIEFGALGLLSVAVLLWTTLRRGAVELWARRGRPDTDRAAASLFAMVSGVLAYALVDGLFYHVVPMALMAMLVALYASLGSDRA